MNEKRPVFISYSEMDLVIYTITSCWIEHGAKQIPFNFHYEMIFADYDLTRCR